MMTREEAIERVRKLLALSSSSNVHEAQLAANMAQQIMTRYQLDAAGLGDDGTSSGTKADLNFSEEPVFNGGRVESWRSCLLNALGAANHCKAFSYRDNGGVTSLWIIGNKSGRQTVSYMFKMLSNIVESMGLEQRGSGRSYVASYKAGVSAALCESVEKAAKASTTNAYAEAAAASQAEGNPNALMRMDNAMSVLKEEDSALEQYLNKKMKFKKAHKAQTRNVTAFNAGVIDGRKVQIGASARGNLSSGSQRISA